MTVSIKEAIMFSNRFAYIVMIFIASAFFACAQQDEETGLAKDYHVWQTYYGAAFTMDEIRSNMLLDNGYVIFARSYTSSQDARIIAVSIGETTDFVFLSYRDSRKVSCSSTTDSLRMDIVRNLTPDKEEKIGGLHPVYTYVEYGYGKERKTFLTDQTARSDFVSEVSQLELYLFPCPTRR